MCHLGGMRKTEKDIAREVKAMTRKEVLLKALEGRIRWWQAAQILGMTARNVRRLRWKMQTFGIEALSDGRSGLPRQARIPVEIVGEMLRLRRERYRDFSVKHFHEFATEKHGLKVSYSWAKLLLQQAGLAQRAAGRGKYHRHRERRPMRGMLLHLDASTHPWIEGLPMMDLVVMLDDADGRILFGRFFEQEGTVSTLWALADVLKHHGRFCELYTDRGSHFCRTEKAGESPAELQHGQVSRVLKALGIRHILARSPEARGRSERAFGTIQGRLPQELRALDIRDYAAANDYLTRVFVPDFNRRFAVSPRSQGQPLFHSPRWSSSCCSPSSTSEWCTTTAPLPLESCSCSCRLAATASTTCAARYWCTSFSMAPWASVTKASCSRASAARGTCSPCALPPKGAPHEFTPPTSSLLTTLQSPLALPSTHNPRTGET